MLVGISTAVMKWSSYMGMYRSRIVVVRGIAVVLAALVITSCKIRIEVPEAGGEVATASGAYQCGPGRTCDIDVVDLFFDETFVATAMDGYEFVSWKKRELGLCGGSSKPCRLFTSVFEGIPLLSDLLETDDVYFLQPKFREVLSGERARTLYVVSMGSTAYPGGFEILEVDPVTGAVDDVHSFAPLGEGYSNNVEGIAFSGGNLFAINTAGNLYELNLSDDTQEFVGVTGEDYWLHLVSDGTDLYGIQSSNELYGIDRRTAFSGFVHSLDEEFTSYYGIDFNTNGVLYGLTADYVNTDEINGFELVLVTSDVQTGRLGQALYSGVELGDPYQYVDMEFTKNGLVVLTNSGALYEIDVRSGALRKYAVIQYEGLGRLTAMAAK
jgi:hypothetical protein